MKQKGIALLLVLSSIMLMSLMISTTYLYLSDMIYFSESNKIKQSEKLLLLSSEDIFFNNVIKEFLTTKDFGDIYSRLSTSPTAIRINNSNVYYSLIDRTSCFNISALYGYFNNIDKNDRNYPWLVLKNILELNNITSPVINKVMMMFTQYSSSKFDLDNVDQELLAIEQDFLMDKPIDKLLNISDENLSRIAPLLCSRNDNTLLININMLDVNNSKLVQSIFMNEITESDIYKIILSKPAQGWISVESFFEFLTNNSAIDIDKINKLRRVKMLKFSHDEYYFSSNFKIDNSSSQLMSLFHVKENKITVLQRRFVI